MMWFWTIFVGAVIGWYILVTLVVGFKGGQDILEILSQMKKNKEDHGQR